MAEVIAHLMYWGYLVFFNAVSGMALCLLIVALLRLGRMVIEHVFEVATLIEAIREARQQGRAPILKAWTRWSDRGQNK